MPLKLAGVFYHGAAGLDVKGSRALKTACLQG